MLSDTIRIEWIACDVAKQTRQLTVTFHRMARLTTAHGDDMQSGLGLAWEVSSCVFAEVDESFLKITFVFFVT